VSETAPEAGSETAGPKADDEPEAVKVPAAEVDEKAEKKASEDKSEKAE
jgi:hypothetical protein